MVKSNTRPTMQDAHSRLAALQDAIEVKQEATNCINSCKLDLLTIAVDNGMIDCLSIDTRMFSRMISK